MRFIVNGKQIQAECGEKLSAYLHIDAPCGGKGKCGKCKVVAKGALSPISDAERGFLTEREIAQGVRMACMAQVLGDVEVFTRSQEPLQIVTGGDGAVRVGNSTVKKYGVAVDIGTTTVVVGLYSATGVLLGKTGALNPQTAWGADVISRIESSLSGQGKALQTAILSTIERLAEGLCEEYGVALAEVDSAVFTGNTTMLYLLTNTPVDGLARMPFALDRPFGETVLAKDLGLKGFAPDMEIYLPPCISPFIGADTTCALLSSLMLEKGGTAFLADVGTNGEMVLLFDGKLYACSTAAGPAFEGAGLTFGMRGEVGAIDHVRVENEKLRFQVIGNEGAKGICGSGVVDLIAALLQTEQLDETGYMEGDISLADGVIFTRKDVRAVQLAKGAIYAGICTLLKTVGISVEQLDTFLLAGGFGGSLDLENAGKIRLLPSAVIPKTQVLGNAAYNGAAILLFDKDSRARCEKLVTGIIVVDLSKNPTFLEEYTDGMTF